MAKSTEAPPIYLQRRGEVLVGEMQLDRDAIAEFKQGDRIKVAMHTGRVPKRLRWYFAFLGKVIDATNCAPNKKALHQVVKLRTGFTDDVIMGGYVIKVPASVSFENMDEATFGKFLDAAVAFIASEFHITPEDAFGEAA